MTTTMAMTTAVPAAVPVATTMATVVSVPVAATVTTTMPVIMATTMTTAVPVIAAAAMTTVTAVSVPDRDPRPPRIKSTSMRMRVSRHRRQQPHRCNSTRHPTTADAHELFSLVSKSAGAILG